MPKMSLELTDSLQSFVDTASTQQGFVSGNEYVLHVLQKEQDRDRFRALIEEAEASPSQEIDVESYIGTLRHRFHTKKDLWLKGLSLLTLELILILKMFSVTTKHNRPFKLERSFWSN